MFYVVAFEEDVSYDVVFKFYSKKNKDLFSIMIINVETEEEMKLEEVTKEDGYYYVKFTVENVGENNHFFELRKYNDSYFGSQGSNTYNSGVAFINDYQVGRYYANKKHYNGTNYYHNILFIILLFRPKKKIIYLFCVTMNIVTNLSMNLCLQSFFSFYYELLLFFEILAFFIEGIIYSIELKNIKKGFVMSLLCNIFSYLLGYFLL